MCTKKKAYKKYMSQENVKYTKQWSVKKTSLCEF